VGFVVKMLRAKSREVNNRTNLQMTEASDIPLNFHTSIAPKSIIKLDVT
jgi:hypothetical protein